MEMKFKTRKHFFAFCILGCIVTGLQAQSSTVATGGNASGSGGSVSFSVGQTSFMTLSGTDGTLTEGVQQPYEISDVTSVEAPAFDAKLEVFPNPASNFIQLSTSETDKSFQYVLLSESGRVIEKSFTSGQNTQIDLSSLPAGVYFLNVNRDNTTVKTFQIIKTNY